jgi:TatA/E family protein of Tat protein translocase
MFGLSFGELILLGAIGLIILGPKQLPEVARMIGRTLNELKRAGGELTNVLVEARDATQKSLLEARDELNKTMELADPTKPSVDSISKEEPKTEIEKKDV